MSEILSGIGAWALTIAGWALLAAAVLAMIACVPLIALGIPGAWIMLGILTVGAIAGRVGWWLLLGLTLLATVGEVLEFLIVRSMNVRFGGSSEAFWGALVGGFVGVLIGLPIPVVGPVIAGLLGTFIGAAAATWHETRKLDDSARIGIVTTIGRVMAAFVKVAAGVVILVAGTVALLNG